MEYELELKKLFDEKIEKEALNKDGSKIEVTKDEMKSISFKIGLFSYFDKNGKVISESNYEPVLNELTENILEMDLKTKLKALWDISKRFLRERMRYIKYTEDNITYTYRGPTMSEM